MPCADQINSLKIRIVEFSDDSGVELCTSMCDSLSLLVSWAEYLSLYKKTGVADELLDAVLSAAREATACVCIGLVRPAIFSMRTMIDLVLSWIYFKDHSVEWKSVNNTGDGFKLKKELFDYFSSHCNGFARRHGVMKQTITRNEYDMYRLLSAHIHGQSIPVLPVAVSLSDSVRDTSMSKEAANLAHGVSEYISDILVSFFADKWHSLPKEITDAVSIRFVSKEQSKIFFDGI